MTAREAKRLALLIIWTPAMVLASEGKKKAEAEGIAEEPKS
jgi:hypothetical protein